MHNYFVQTPFTIVQHSQTGEAKDNAFRGHAEIIKVFHAIGGDINFAFDHLGNCIITEAQGCLHFLYGHVPVQAGVIEQGSIVALPDLCRLRVVGDQFAGIVIDHDAIRVFRFPVWISLAVDTEHHADQVTVFSELCPVFIGHLYTVFRLIQRPQRIQYTITVPGLQTGKRRPRTHYRDGFVHLLRVLSVHQRAIPILIRLGAVAHRQFFLNVGCADRRIQNDPNEAQFQIGFLFTGEFNDQFLHLVTKEILAAENHSLFQAVSVLQHIGLNRPAHVFKVFTNHIRIHAPS